MSAFFHRYHHVFIKLLCVDVFIVLLHLLLSQQHTFFHLDHEWNLPTFYQSGKLIFFASFFGYRLLFHRQSIKLEYQKFILPLALFMLLLGLDELLQIHENIYRIFEFLPFLHPSKIVDASMKLGYRSSLWILYYLPFILLFVFWSGYWLRYFQDKLKSNMWVIWLSSVSFFLVLLMEVLSSTGSYSDQTYFIMVTIEESAEMMLGSTLALVGLKVINHAKQKNS